MSGSGLHPDLGSHPAFAALDHRPWPLPDGRWRWRQAWRDLLFAHWPVPADLIRPLVPAGLAVQEFEGTSWVGVVPFLMADVAPRPFPPLPRLSFFPELNVRVYVERDGKPGVWFLSLDAASRVAVTVGRRFFHVPYYLAAIEMERDGPGFAFNSRRVAEQAVFDGHYEPVSEVAAARPGTLAHFLTERYCLYAQGPDGRLYRSEVHHVPWPLQAARADIRVNDVAAAGGLALAGPLTLLHFAKGVDVVIWGPERCG